MIEQQRLLIDRKTLEVVRDYVPKDDALTSMSEMCVTDLSLSLGINQTTVSHQLKNLKAIGAVKVRRQGKVAFYSLSDNSILDIMLKAVNFV